MRKINFRQLLAGVGTAVIIGAISAPVQASPATPEPALTHVGGYITFLEPVEDGPAPDFSRSGEVNILVEEQACTSERSRKLAGLKDGLVFSGLVIDCKNGKPTYQAGWHDVDGELNYLFDVAPGEVVSAELRTLDPENGSDTRMQKWLKKAGGTWEADNYYREQISIGIADTTMQVGVFQDSKKNLTPGTVTFYNFTINEDKLPDDQELGRVINLDGTTTSDMGQNPAEPTWKNVFEVHTK